MLKFRVCYRYKWESRWTPALETDSASEAVKAARDFYKDGWQVRIEDPYNGDFDADPELQRGDR